MLRRFFSMVVLVTFVMTSVFGPNVVYAQGLLLPEPGTMVGASAAFIPLGLKGMTVRVDQPLLFG